MNTTCPVAPETLDSMMEWLTPHQSLSLKGGRTPSFVDICSQMAIKLAESDVIKAAACRFGCCFANHG
jgi:hypothetical protein